MRQWLDPIKAFITDKSPSPRQWAIFFLIIFATRLVWIGLYRSYALYVKQSVESQDNVFENGNIARNLIAGKGFFIEGDEFNHYAGPTAHKPPGFPLLLAVLFKCFGDNNLMAVRFVQAVMMSAALLILMRLFGRIFNPSIGLWVGFLMTFNPVLAKADTFIENIAIAIFLSSLFMSYLWDALQQDDKAPAKAGFFMGVTALTNAAFAPFYPLALGLLWFKSPKEQRLRKCLTMAGVAFLVMLPWTLRNHAVFGRWIPVNSNYPFNFWMGSNPLANGSFILYGGAPFPIPAEILEQTRGMNEAERNSYFGKIGKRYAIDHPKHFLMTRVRAYFFFWMTSRPWMGYGKRIDILNVGVAVIMLITAAIGFLLSARTHPLAFCIFSLLFLAYSSVYGFAHADSIDRYRLPLDPYLLGFSAYALNDIRQRLLKTLRRV